MDTLECSTERVEELDESLTVLNYDGRKWLIGVQVAAALNRETFNMYRSMKVKGVDLTRAAPAHVEWLIRQGVVKGGTHSVTLIPYDTGLSFINCTPHPPPLSPLPPPALPHGVLQISPSPPSRLKPACEPVGATRTRQELPR